MFIQLDAHGQYLRHCMAGVLVEWDAWHYCAPEALTPDEADHFRVFPLTLADRLVHDEATHRCVEAGPHLVGGSWVQRWELEPLPDVEVEENLAAREKSRVSALWQAAHDYEFQQISGSAIGLLAMGVMTGKPKCVAVQNWIKSIWTVYYARKAAGDWNTDYTACGEIPHSVPELMAELGV